MEPRIVSCEYSPATFKLTGGVSVKLKAKAAAVSLYIVKMF